MNQQKIIVLVSSFLCGSLIIFLAFRNHQDQKNNLLIKKKEEKKRNNSKFKSSSLLFLMAPIIIIFIGLTIIYFNNFKYSKDTNKKNKKITKNIKNNYINNKNENNHIENSECSLLIDGRQYDSEHKRIIKHMHIYLLPNSSDENMKKIFEQLWTIDITNKIENDEFNDLYTNAKENKKEIEKFFYLITEIFKYINNNLLQEIHQNNYLNENDILTIMSAKFIKQKNVYQRYESILLYSEQILEISQETIQQNSQEIIYLNSNNSILLFKSIMKQGFLKSYKSKEFIFFKLFLTLHKLTTNIRKSLKNFINQEKSKKHQDLLNIIETNEKNINSFLNNE